jgi:RNA polymerase sigma-70 factor, ECF subfamily
MSSMVLLDVQHVIINLMPDLRRFALSLTRSADAADELVQAAYERALSSLRSQVAVGQPASWMRCIIRNLWIDEKRSSRVRLSVPLENGKHVATEDTERVLIARSTLAWVHAEVATMPEKQRCPIVLVCFEGLSYQEAAAKLDIPIGTLMCHLFRARLELARRVQLPF